MENQDKNDKNEGPVNTSAKIIDQIKKSGEFDKYRRELASDIINSSEMQKLIEKCKGIIEDTLLSTSDADLQKHGIAQLREYVRGEIKRRKLVDNTMSHVLDQHMQRLHPILSVRMEEMVHAELGIPPPPKEVKQELPDDNLELIDMEVSSGGSEDTTSNTPGTNSPSRRPASSSTGKRRNCSENPSSSTSHHSVSNKKSSRTSEKSSGEKQIDIIGVDEEEDASALLDKFADSISACTSSLSCNASEDGIRPGADEPSPSEAPSACSSSSIADSSPHPNHTNLNNSSAAAFDGNIQKRRTNLKRQRRGDPS